MSRKKIKKIKKVFLQGKILPIFYQFHRFDRKKGQNKFLYIFYFYPTHTYVIGKIGQIGKKTK